MSFLNPKKIISGTIIGVSHKVADFGFGSGVFVKILSEKVGQDGHVYAFDIRQEIVGSVSNECRELKIDNVSFLTTDLEKDKSTKLEDSILDFVLISSLFFQLENKEKVAKEAKRILKKNGKILFIEWKDYYKGIGPDKNLIFTKKEAINLFETLGLNLVNEISAGDYHYCLIFEK